jgi:hypothetical protein
VRAVRSGSSKSSDPGRSFAASRSARAGYLVFGLLITVAIADAASGQTVAPSNTGYPSRFCLLPSAGLSIDHVVVAVSHLPVAEADFRSLGFRLKPGRRHENGLRNAHIKFQDGSALELMTVEGRATDPVAGAYEAFLAGGDGAAFVAIEADLEKVGAAAEALGLDWDTSSAGAYSWVTLSDSTPVFFIEWSRRPLDPDSPTAHVAGVSGISSVRLTGTDEFGRLLSGLGATRCPAGGRPDSPGADTARPVQTIQLLDRLDTRFEIREVMLAGGRCTGARRLDPARTHGVAIVIAPPISCSTD